MLFAIFLMGKTIFEQLYIELWKNIFLVNKSLINKYIVIVEIVVDNSRKTIPKKMRH